jgi:hypothetical protein
LVIILVYFEVPVVGELQLKSGVVTGLHLEDISEEVGAETNVDGLDDTWSLGLAS